MYLVVDFRTEQGDAVSAIVAGDNGTGKSSIVDALEFALQAWINRSQSFVNRKSNEPIGVAPHGTVVRLHPRPPAATSAFAHAIWALRRVAPQTSTTPPSTNDDL